MPATTTTRQRNDQIRAAAAELPSWYSQRDRAERLAVQFGLSAITVANILRGRDLNPPPSARNRRQRRAAGETRTSRRLGLDRRFGVEIEFFGVARYRVQSAIDNGSFGSGWRVKSDCSVSGEGLELVSPPLQGQLGLDAVRQACTVLQELGARVNRSCGLHVHHEARDLQAAGIARVARLWARHQHLVNWLVSPSRREGATYCRPMTGADADAIERSCNAGYVSAPTRYLALNVSSFGRHGTVEIRQHQGTLNFRKIEAWILLGQGFMDAAAEDRRTLNANGSLQSLITNVVADEDAAAFLIGRGFQLGCPSMTTPVAA